MKADRKDETKTRAPDRLRALHLRWGWAALLLFLTLGIGLELLHGFKAGLYLDVSQSTRRFLWTLAHAHGTLLGLVNIAFALTCGALGPGAAAARERASAALRAATVLLPGGFFLGGLSFHGGDPGLGILLVPLGALALLAGVAGITREVFRDRG